jgi:dTDP-4-dehydrorhamnose reductase
MKVIITGAGGMLGKDVCDLMSKDGSFQVYPLDIRPLPHPNAITLDITDKEKLNEALNKMGPEVIIHCAAYTDVKWCEQENNHKATDKLHVDSTRELASHNRARFVYISTDSIFDGKLGDYSEDATPSPVTYYAKSKLKGEVAALQSNANSLIIRTNIYGFHVPQRMNSFFVDGALDKLLSKDRINGYDNIFVNFIYTKQLARVISKLLKIDIKGTLNVASKEKTSKYDFLLKLAKVFGCDPALINKQPAPQAQNPGDTSLNINRLIKLLNEAPSIDEGVMELRSDYREKML